MAELPHFHIRWLPSRALDWQKFDTQKEAELRADELVLPGENYKIEVVIRECKLCAALDPRNSAPKRFHKRAAG